MSLTTSETDLTITVAEAAKALKIGINQAYEAVEQKKIPAMRIGRRWLVLRVPFERMLRGEA